MTVLRLNLFLLLLTWPLLATAQFFLEPESQQDSITITYRDLTLKKKNKRIPGRLHIRFSPQSAWVAANDFDKLPKFFKRFTLQSANKRYRFSRKDMLPAVQPTLDARVDELKADTTFFTNRVRKKQLLQFYPRNRDKFFAGGGGGFFFKHNWIPLYTVSEVLTAPITLNVYGTLFRKARYRTDRLPMSFAPRLPALDTTPCTPINRFHELRKMNGYGIDRFKYHRYRAPDREPVRHSVELYFDKNSITPKPEDLKRVIEFLRENNYSILNATIEGYSSMEGSEENNLRLQKKRANVLLDALRQYNSEPIVSDTLIIMFGYELFRQSIKNTPYQGLDTLSNEDLRLRLNTDAALLQSVEPYLSQHRKASLRLVLAKRLEGEDLFARVKRDFTYWERQLDPKESKGASPPEVEARVMGIIAYLFELMVNDQITSKEYADVIDNAVNNNLTRILSVYHEIILFERSNHRDSLLWDKYANDRKFNDSFLVAQLNLIALIQRPGNLHIQYEKFRRQLVDIQTYTFDYVKNGWLSLEAMCELDYPNSPRFRSYKLNQLSFLQYMTQFGDVPCEKLVLTRNEKPKTYSDDWLDELAEDYGGSLQVSFPDGRYRPSYGKPVYSPLLFYLKLLFIAKEPSIRQHVISSDNLYEFDLLTLVHYNVTNWEPLENHFQDAEVQLEEMNKLVSLLKKINKRICPDQINQLYLDYHLKALQYLSLYFEPGNSRQTEIAQQSMTFISRYYSRHAGIITPRLSLYLLNQLNAMHDMPGRYSGTWYAWNLLKSISARRNLTPEESLLFRKYERYYTNAKKSKRAITDSTTF
ncbi:MAG: hypothetical protein KF846_16390 [Cyclobacteriaceae bacterium]|nr:hypothetical protein [Cyclobacteriaceae bacterium]